jgi:hypothetical protein
MSPKKAKGEDSFGLTEVTFEDNIGEIGACGTISTPGPSSKEGTRKTVPKSDFDKEAKDYLEEIFREVQSSGDYAQARKDTLEVIKDFGLHKDRYRIFCAIDKFEKGKRSIADEQTSDKGKARDPRERPKKSKEWPETSGDERGDISGLLKRKEEPMKTMMEDPEVKVPAVTAMRLSPLLAQMEARDIEHTKTYNLLRRQTLFGNISWINKRKCSRNSKENSISHHFQTHSGRRFS